MQNKIHCRRAARAENSKDAVPARADKQIRIRDFLRVKIASQKLLRDLLRLKRALPDGPADTAHGAHELVPASVVDGNRQVQVVIHGRHTIRLNNLALKLRLETADITDHPDVHLILVSRSNRLVQIAGKKPHQCTHLRLGARPVLGGKRIERQVFHPELFRRNADILHVFRPRPVPGVAGQSPFLRPSSVSVHNDRNMLRNTHHMPPSPSGRFPLAPLRIIKMRHDPVPHFCVLYGKNLLALLIDSLVNVCNVFICKLLQLIFQIMNLVLGDIIAL